MRLLQHLLIAGCALAAAVAGAEAQEHIGSTALAHNEVTRDLSGASAPLVAGDSVFRNEVVRTGPDSTAKLIFLDSTNLGVGPVSSVKLDQFVYVGESNGQKMTVNLAKGVFRFTTGALDKKAYEIQTPTAAIGVRGTVLDIGVQNGQSKVTSGRGAGAHLSAPILHYVRAAGAQLHPGWRRGSALRLHRPREHRSDRAGQEGQGREHRQPDLDAG